MKPLDVLFLLKAGGQFEDMKTFVKAFIKNADIGEFDPAHKRPATFFLMWTAFHCLVLLLVLFNDISKLEDEEKGVAVIFATIISHIISGLTANWIIVLDKRFFCHLFA